MPRCINLRSLIPLVIVSLTFFLATNALATQPPSAFPLDYWQINNDAFEPNRPHIENLPERDLQHYYRQMLLTPVFLDSMQEHDPEDNEFGGMHEGEGRALWAIVESDNTQESIRVWCEYARIFNDPDTYRQNIEDAWVYLSNFPAWEESPAGQMYGLHNSGWGLVAEMGYRRMYNDSQREYGLSCADHLVEHTPEILPNNEDNLMPLVAGWAAGTLYEYGVFENNEQYCQRALEIANQVKTWIDTNPDRLNNNETWALSGGTAMWGVLRSLGKSDSAETADWAVDRLEHMDVIAGHGNWNTSWNIWYAHAWIAAHELTGNIDYQANAAYIVDSLLVMDTDEDGGIPATIGEDNNVDQSWVSAYTMWMGLSNLYEIVPEIDGRLLSLTAPSLNRPYPTGSPLDFSLRVVNQGSDDLITLPVRIVGAFEAEAEIELESWEPAVLTFDDVWTPEEAGIFEITAFIDHPDDADRGNDSLHLSIEILPAAEVILSASNENNEGIGCNYFFYNLDLNPDTVFTSYRVEVDEQQTILDLMSGRYTVRIIPDFPYARQEVDFIVITPDDENDLSRVFTHPHVLLIDNDSDSTRSKYFTEPLDELSYSYYCWHSQAEGLITDCSPDFETIIYFTGNRDTLTIPPDDQTELASCLAQGGNIFVTGQHIADEYVGSDFLANVLHSTHLSDNVRQAMVLGVENDEIMGEHSMLLLGSRGANNQTEKSALAGANGGVVCAYYQDRPDSGAVVRWEEENGAKGIFFGFGFEAVSGVQSSNRAQVMQTILSWMGTTQSVDDDEDQANPQLFSLVSMYPNPTNGAVQISIENWSGNARALIYDLNGRLIRTIAMSSQRQVCWDARNSFNKDVASGTYLIQILDNKTQGILSNGKVVILR